MFGVWARSLLPRAVIAAFAYLPLEARAAEPCTLLLVAKAEAARHKVYFTKFLKEDNTGGRYKTCRIVTSAEKGTETFFVTPFRQDATLIVHPSNWP